LGDPGGVPLDQLLGRPLDLEFLLRLAISLSTAIGHLHQRGIIHKDIIRLVHFAQGGDSLCSIVDLDRTTGHEVRSGHAHGLQDIGKRVRSLG
jgi:hypothetical protein